MSLIRVLRRAPDGNDRCAFTIANRGCIATLARYASIGIVVVGVLAAALMPSPARAQERDVYTIAGVPVDASSETAARARDVALAEGQRRAFERLLRRLTLSADHGRLPRLPESAITGYVAGFQVTNERTSATRYLAALTVSFKRPEVRDLLRTAGIPFSETVSRPVLVLPVYRAAGGETLWESPNPWRDAWLSAAYDPDALLPIRLPEGGLTDMAAISAAQAVGGDAAAIAAVAQRYGIDDVLVAVADAEGEDPASPSRVQVTLRRHGAGGSPQVQVQSFGADGQPDALGRAVAEINRETQEAWKRESLIRFDREQRLSASVPLQDLADWVDIRRRLSRVSLIQRHELTAMTGKDAQVVLYYWGEPSRLALALAQASLELTEETGGFWSLRRPGRAAP